MFTLGAIVFATLIGWYANRANNSDRKEYNSATPDDRTLVLLTLHVREDVKLIAFLLAGILVMLGVVADRMQ
jgi:hypothetical protein